jgi:hypothetical protein
MQNTLRPKRAHQDPQEPSANGRDRPSGQGVTTFTAVNAVGVALAVKLEGAFHAEDGVMTPEA